MRVRIGSPSSCHRTRRLTALLPLLAALSLFLPLSFAGALDTLAAQSFGAGSMEGVNLWTKRALLLVSILTVPVMILLALGYPFLKHVLGQSEEISVDGALYCQWMILGIWPQNMTVVLQKYLQAQESQ